MANAQGSSPGARAYAQALLELLSSDAQATEVGDELSRLSEMMQQDATVRSFLLDPSLGQRERWTIIEKAFAGKLTDLTVNVLGVLNKKGRMALLPDVTNAYRVMLDERLKRVRVQMTVSQRLDQQQMESVQQRVSAALGKTAIIEQKIDESIIGGMVLRVDDRVMDASVRAQLEAMREQLLAARSAR